MGSVIAAATLIALAVGSYWQDSGTDKSLAFATLVGAQLSAAFVFRSETESVLRLRPNHWLSVSIAASIFALIAVFYLPPLQNAFETRPLLAEQWLVVVGLSLLPLLVGEAAKFSGILSRLGLVPGKALG